MDLGEAGVIDLREVAAVLLTSGETGAVVSTTRPEMYYHYLVHFVHSSTPLILPETVGHQVLQAWRNRYLWDWRFR
jgi:hypothetical protein